MHLNWKPARICLLAALPLMASGQNLPDAGMLMHNFEQNLRPNPLGASVSVYPPELHIPDKDSTIVQYSHVVVQGNAHIATDQLQSTWAEYIDAPIRLSQLNELIQSIQLIYNNNGLKAKVYIPRQKLSGTTLTIQVIEYSSFKNPTN
jgi:hemolysin activation/secretion protein